MVSVCCGTHVEVREQLFRSGFFFSILKELLLLYYAYEFFPAYMQVHTMCVQCLRRPEGIIRFLYKLKVVEIHLVGAGN